MTIDRFTPMGGCGHIAHILHQACPVCTNSMGNVDVIALITKRLKDEPPIEPPKATRNEPATTFVEPQKPVVIEEEEPIIPILIEWSDVIAEKCFRSLAWFVRTYWPIMMPGITLHWNWHLEEICRHVQAVLEEWITKQLDPTYKMKCQNFVINCPPRSLKSTIVSICAPAWMWLRWPSWKALFLSANPHVAIRDARACHVLITGEWYCTLKNTLAERFEEDSDERRKFEWGIDPGHDADGDFANTAGGIRLAMGFTAIVVGLGGDAIFIDDPNDAKKVLSEAERTRVNDTWDLSLANRVNDYMSSVRIMIMQRLHEQDLTGHVMAEGSWIQLPIPLEYDPEWVIETPFGYHDPRTVAGECVHPARFSPEVIASELKRLGSYGFAGQMNQRPAPLEGGIFARGYWNFCKLNIKQPDLNPLQGCKPIMGTCKRPAGCTDRPAMDIPFLDSLTITVDATFGSLEVHASNVGLLVIGRKGADNFVLHDSTKARTFPDTKSAIKEMLAMFPSASRTLIEKKANGAAIIQDLQHDVSGLIPIEANENWVSRANAMLPSVESGNWYLLEGAPWLEAFVGEFGVFPNGAKDDRIDAAAQFSAYFNDGNSLPDW